MVEIISRMNFKVSVFGAFITFSKEVMICVLFVCF